MALKVVNNDPAEDLSDPMDQAELLAEAFATGDPALVDAALDTIVRARSMSQVAEKAKSAGPA